MPPAFLRLASLVLACAAPLGTHAAPGSPAPRDVPYPGTLTLSLDATDLDHRLFAIHETLPVSPGPLTLLFPRWLPGDHGPYGKPSRLAGLVIHANGRQVPWQRDPLDPLAWRLTVPEGATQLELDFQHVNPLEGSEDAITMTRTMLRVQWEGDVLYPAGYWSSRIPVAARLRVPAGWQVATALRDANGAEPAADAQGWRQYAPLSLEHLVDSPVLAGAHYKRIELDPPGTARPVALDLFADADDQLTPTPAQVDAHKRLVQQADRLFGTRHFRHYDFITWQSDVFGQDGLEHHESSENGLANGYFEDWDKSVPPRQLLPHEFAHSWNGKFRRPADLWTPNFNEPMSNSLLWVYEGLTEFWGEVLAARSGMVDPQQARDDLAEIAAAAQSHVGSRWRSLQDTTLAASLADDGTPDWESWQRRTDYYDDGALVWLELDMQIRQQSHGQRSLDDFTRRFFGMGTNGIEPLTYRFEDVIAALEAVQPGDWAALLRQRLDAVGDTAPLQGLERSGWRLAWSETETPTLRGRFTHGMKTDHFQYSIGLTIANKDARIRQVQYDSPAFAAGLAGGMTLVAVNMQEYTPERLQRAITANKDGQHPIELLAKEGDTYRLVRLDWRGGLRYPVLERIADRPDLLSKLLGPKA